MPLAAISAISAGILAYELLLMRLYAIVQWHHFAFMIISIALLGYGASGTFLALARERLLARFTLAWQINAVLFGLTAVAAFALAQRLPFNPLEILWAPRQLLYLGASYLVLLVPFFCGANCIGLAFIRFPDRIGRIYRFDLIGAGLGAMAVTAVLFVLPAAQALVFVLWLGLGAAALAGLGAGRRHGRAGALLLAALGAVLTTAMPERWVAPRLNEYKALSHALRYPDAAIVAERSGPLGWIAVVRSPTIPFRHAPGLSLNAPTGPPAQLGLFIDGEGMSAITRFDGDLAKLAYLDFTTEAAPYHLLESPKVLIVGLGGGEGVLRAHFHHARSIEAVELDVNVARLLAKDYAPFTGGLLAPDRLRVHIADGRSYLAASGQLYDLIQIPPLESFAAAAAGTGGFSESYVYTVEAIGDYLARLAPGGLIALTRWLKLPPRDSLKLVATAIAALERAGVAEPGRRLALIRSWRTTTLLVGNGLFGASEIAKLKAFAAARSFDLAYYPGMPGAEANRYNRLDAPLFYDGVRALLGPGRKQFLADYKFDLRPARDDRPYFLDFFRWRSLPELLALRAQGGMPLIERGYLILLATLAQAAALSALLILAPLKALRRRNPAAPGGRARLAVYFLALGLAFLFIEIAFIQRLTLFLGHPLYAVAVALAAFLIFAGLGAGFAPRVAAATGGANGRAIAVAVAAIAAIVLLDLAALPALLHLLMPAPVAIKGLAALALIAPLAFVMGLPFPLGLAEVARALPSDLPWAWGLNGCASVISAVLAVILAIELGFTAVLAGAIALYGLAAASFWKPL